SYFGTLARDGTGDFDGDGLSDLAEYLAGTDPTNRPTRCAFRMCGSQERASPCDLPQCPAAGIESNRSITSARAPGNRCRKLGPWKARDRWKSLITASRKRKSAFTACDSNNLSHTQPARGIYS